MGKRILILNGSFCELPIIQKAKEMGHYVITTGNMPDLIGHKYSDEYINADYSDKELILDIVRKKKVDRIISCANDFGVLTASYVAEKMGWPGHDSYANAELLHHKDKFKAFTMKHHIPSPRSTIFTNIEDARRYIASVDYPIIVKANDLTGGKGIMKATNREEANIALDNAFAKSRDKHIVIEPFIEGTQHSIVTFVVDKKVRASVSCNCYSPTNPYLIQSETLPADHIDQLQETLIEIIEMISRKLDLVDGMFTLQYILSDGKIYIIEAMRRCFGNQFLTLAGLASGFPWEEALIQAETGGSCQALQCILPVMKYCGHYGIMASRNGILKNYRIDPSIENHIFQKFEILKPGMPVIDYLNERIAYLYYQYDNREEMLADVTNMNKYISVELED